MPSSCNSIGIILPTGDGRETVCDATLAALERSRPCGWEFIVEIPENYPTIGEAWNTAVDALDADYVFFTCDDFEPDAGWVDAATKTVDAGFIPSPQTRYASGLVERGSMGFGVFLQGDVPDWTPCRSAPVIFTRPEWYTELVGGFLPIHYSVDDDWTWRAACKGIPCAYREAYAFTHHHDQGRADTRRVIDRHRADHEAFLMNCLKLGNGHSQNLVRA